MKSLQELMESFRGLNAVNSLNHSAGKEEPVCVYRGSGAEIRIMKDGRVLYAADKRKTTFMLSDCLSYRYPTGNDGTVLTYEDFANLNWTIWTCLYGEQRLEHNSDCHFSRTFYGMHDSDSLSQTDYIREKGEELLVDPSDSPEQSLIQRESLEEVISCLSERHKTFVRFRYLYNLTLAETAIKMNCSYSAAAKIDARVREKLRQNYLKRTSKKSGE